MNNDIVFGWSPSELDGTEHIADYKYENKDLPVRFSYEGMIPKVLNQGSTSTCVPHSISSIYDWKTTLENGNPTSFNMSIYNIYDKKTNMGEGMSFKEALSILRYTGAVTTNEYKKKDYSNAVKIDEYAMIKNPISMKYAVFMNGPCLVATMVRDIDSMEYWKGRGNYGGHAVACVGWDETGLIIRNSWGNFWGNNGYTHMKYEDFGYILESWTTIFKI